MDFTTKDAHGQLASPVLPLGKRNIMIDIDGTICEDIPNEESERMATATPYLGAKSQINSWYSEGHIITFFTSRNSELHREITQGWLDKHGFNYHQLLMDKPRGGSYTWIDNHEVNGIRYQTDWKDVSTDFAK